MTTVTRIPTDLPPCTAYPSRARRPPPEPPVPPSRRGRRVAWVVLGVVLLGAIGFAAYAAGLQSGRDGAATDAWFDGGSGDPLGGVDGDGPDAAAVPSTRYAPVEAMCDTIDFSPFFDVLPMDEKFYEYQHVLGDTSLAQCSFDGVYGPYVATLSVDISTYGTVDDAVRWYKDTLDRLRATYDRLGYEPRIVEIGSELGADPDMADLLWPEGVFAFAAEVRTTVHLVATQDNLVVNLEFSSTAGITDESELLGPRDALAQVAHNIRELMAG